MSIISQLFGSKPAAAAQQQPAQQQPNQHVNNNPTVPNDTNVPAQQATNEPSTGQSPTDQFKDLWSNAGSQQGNQTPNFQLNPDQLNQVASRVNFTNGITQDHMTKVMAGGQEAAQALVEILNTVGQNVFKTNAQFTSNLTEAGYNSAQKTIGSTLPTLVTSHLSKNELFQANPQLRNPTFAPVVEAMHAQLQSKYPGATPAEINAHMGELLKQFGTAMNPAAPQQNIPKGPDQADFSSFLQ